MHALLFSLREFCNCIRMTRKKTKIYKSARQSAKQSRKIQCMYGILCQDTERVWIINNALERNLIKDANEHSLLQDTLVKDLDKKQKDALWKWKTMSTAWR